MICTTMSVVIPGFDANLKPMRLIRRTKAIPEIKYPDNHKFDFDISKEEEWRKFLSDFRLPNGKKLPRFSEDNYPIAYRVVVFGGYDRIKVLFPGKDENGKNKNPAHHGFLLK